MNLDLTVCYAAAPFQADAVQAVLPYLDFLILNQIEAEQLRDKPPVSVAIRLCRYEHVVW